MIKRVSLFSLICWLVLLLFPLGCSLKEPGKSPDYSKFIQAKPRSILILPPINNTTEVYAGESFLSWSSRPLAEMGYYVVPIALVVQTFRMNGLTEPMDMHGVSLKKLGEVFGVDAVMYITIEEFGTKFLLVNSVTQVRALAQLVDVRTGMELWSGEEHKQASSNSSNNDLVGMFLTAVIDQVVNTSADQAHREVAPSVAWQLFTKRGIYPGPYAPAEEKAKF